MLGAQSGTSEREWECEVVLCESEMSEEEDIAAVMGFSGFGKTCKDRSHFVYTAKLIKNLMTVDPQALVTPHTVTGRKGLGTCLHSSCPHRIQL